MKRSLLTLMLVVPLVCGCAGRVNTDLLQARIREQAIQLSESQREMAKTRSELKQTRQEAERLKAELAQSGPVDATVSSAQISKIRIIPLASGGINKDDTPGDDAMVVQFVPLDQDNAPIKVPGNVELTVFDPQLPESQSELGRWNFSEEECQNHWTRGIASTGFQFTVPFEQLPTHANLVVRLKYKAGDKRYDVNQAVKVAVASGNAMAANQRQRKKPVQVVDDSDEFLPPVGSRDPGPVDDDWAKEEQDGGSTKAGHTVLHSSSWTDDTIPRLR